MKLRQKLAIVLASAMVVTAVPVVTMAKSTNNVTTNAVYAKDSTVTASSVKIQATDAKVGETFVLKITNAEFLADSGVYSGNYVAAMTDATVTILSKTELKVVINTAGATLEIPLYAKLTGGDATVEIQPENSSVSADKFVFARTEEKAAKVTADSNTFYAGTQTVGALTFTDVTPGSIKAASDRVIKLTLDHNDYTFGAKGATQTLNVSVGRGYTGAATTVTATVDANDNQVMTFTLPNGMTASTILGTVKVEGISVVASTKTPELGDLKVIATGATIADTTVKVATVADYGVTLTGTSQAYVSGANAKEVKFKLTEVLADSIRRGNEIEFKLNEGKFDSVKLDGATLALSSDSKTATFTLNNAAKFDKEFVAMVKTDVAYEGDVTLTASGTRAIGDDQQITILKAERDFTYDSEQAVVKVGETKQKVGKVVLTEDAKGVFEKGKQITFSIPSGNGVVLTGEPTVTVTGDDKFKFSKSSNKNVTNGSLSFTITVDRASVAPVTITVEGFEVSVDRTVPHGNVALTVGGAAVAENGSAITVSDFFSVGTPNAEELATNGLPKGTAKFVIGSTTATVNGKEVAVDAAPQLVDFAGVSKTMVPLRHLSTAFGVAENNILYSNGTATIFAGTRTIQLTRDSKVAIVNGVSITMDAPATIINGRLFVPLGDIAQIVGVKYTWDNAEKSVVFENK